MCVQFVCVCSHHPQRCVCLVYPRYFLVCKCLCVAHVVCIIVCIYIYCHVRHNRPTHCNTLTSTLLLPRCQLTTLSPAGTLKRPGGNSPGFAGISIHLRWDVLCIGLSSRTSSPVHLPNSFHEKLHPSSMLSTLLLVLLAGSRPNQTNPPRQTSVPPTRRNRINLRGLENSAPF